MRGLAVLALLLLALGLPRWFVVCDDGAQHHLEAAGCCHHAHAATPSPCDDDERLPVAAASHSHTTLAWQPALAPRSFQFALPAANAVAVLAEPPFASAPPARRAHHAPSTGPPRWHERTERLRSTILRL